MWVLIVSIEYDYEGSIVLGVFSNMESAKKAAQAYIDLPPNELVELEWRDIANFGDPQQPGLDQRAPMNNSTEINIAHYKVGD